MSACTQELTVHWVNRIRSASSVTPAKWPGQRRAPGFPAAGPVPPKPATETRAREVRFSATESSGKNEVFDCLRLETIRRPDLLTERVRLKGSFVASHYAPVSRLRRARIEPSGLISSTAIQ